MMTIAAAATRSTLLTVGRTARAGEVVRWQRSALGAQVSIEIYGPDRAEAERLVERCVLDMRRLEQQFSLYLADSVISTLYRAGILVSPDADMVALLKASLHFAARTAHAFDLTVAGQKYYTTSSRLCSAFRESLNQFGEHNSRRRETTRAP